MPPGVARGERRAAVVGRRRPDQPRLRRGEGGRRPRASGPSWRPLRPRRASARTRPARAGARLHACGKDRGKRAHGWPRIAVSGRSRPPATPFCVHEIGGKIVQLAVDYDFPALAEESIRVSLCSSPPLSGSYPQPDWLIDRERLGARLPPRVRARELWRVSKPYLEEAQKDATRLAVQDMERAGVDVVTDGEMRRESYSNRFATALDGVDLDNSGVALDRTGHENPVPRVVGPIRRTRPVEVEDVEFFACDHRPQNQDHRPRAFHDDPTGSERPLRRRSESRARVRRRRECRAPGSEGSGRRRGPGRRALSPSAPDPAREYALEAIDRALAGIEGETVLHTCFGYAHIVKKRLTGYPLLRELNECAATHLSLEAAQPASIRKCCATFRTK